MTTQDTSLLERLQRAEQEQRWSDAETLCRQLLQSDPNHWPLWQRLARAIEARQDWAQAETLWRHLTQRFAQRSEPYLALAALQRKRGAPDAARQVLERASEQLQGPSDLQAALRQVDDPWAQGSGAPALGPEASVEQVAAVLSAAQKHLDAGQPLEAEACFLSLSRARPQSLKLQLQLAQLRLRRGDLEAVVAQLQPLLSAADPASSLLETPQLPLLLAGVYQDLERWDALVALLTPLQSRFASSPKLPLLLAQAAAAQGRDAEAMPLLQQSLRLDSQQAEAELALAGLFRRLGDFAAAIEAYSRALAIAPDSAEASRLLQQTRSEQFWQRGEEAIRQADWAAALTAFRPLLDDPAFEQRALARIELLESLDPTHLPVPLHGLRMPGFEEQLNAFHSSLDRLEQRLKQALH